MKNKQELLDGSWEIEEANDNSLIISKKSFPLSRSSMSLVDCVEIKFIENGIAVYIDFKIPYLGFLLLLMAAAITFSLGIIGLAFIVLACVLNLLVIRSEVTSDILDVITKSRPEYRRGHINFFVRWLKLDKNFSRYKAILFFNAVYLSLFLVLMIPAYVFPKNNFASFLATIWTVTLSPSFMNRLIANNVVSMVVGGMLISSIGSILMFIFPKTIQDTLFMMALFFLLIFGANTYFLLNSAP